MGWIDSPKWDLEKVVIQEWWDKNKNWSILDEMLEKAQGDNVIKKEELEELIKKQQQEQQEIESKKEQKQDDVIKPRLEFLDKMKNFLDWVSTLRVNFSKDIRDIDKLTANISKLSKEDQDKVFNIFNNILLANWKAKERFLKYIESKFDNNKIDDFFELFEEYNIKAETAQDLQTKAQKEAETIEKKAEAKEDKAEAILALKGGRFNNIYEKYKNTAINELKTDAQKNGKDIKSIIEAEINLKIAEKMDDIINDILAEVEKKKWTYEYAEFRKEAQAVFTEFRDAWFIDSAKYQEAINKLNSPLKKEETALTNSEARNNFSKDPNKILNNWLPLNNTKSPLYYLSKNNIVHMKTKTQILTCI